jgi:hypothetical protein
MDPVPNWHICVQGSRYRIVNASRKYSARVSEFLAARSFRHCRCMAGFGRSEHDHLCPRPETHLTYMINLAPVPALARWLLGLGVAALRAFRGHATPGPPAP